MANHASAKKRMRQIQRKTTINRSRVSRIRTFCKSVESALARGDRDAAESALKLAEPELQRGVTKGVVHRNTAARKISRLTRRVCAL